MCRPCNGEYQRAHYQRNRADYLLKALAWQEVRRTENVARILEYFAAHPCVGCGERDPLVLHFDHRGNKVDEVTDLVYGGANWERIAAEIEKCDVRCGRCHFTRHAVADNWLKLQISNAPRVAGGAASAVAPGLRSTPAPALDPAALKWCGSCGWDLHLIEFSHKDGSRRNWKCKHCQRAYARDHYRRNRTTYLARVRLRHQVYLARNMALLVEYLLDHPCVDCGHADPVTLLFDHVRGTKSRNIAQMIRDGVTWRRLEEEIAKCDVRCVNCHLRRHAVARNTRKVRSLSAQLS